MSTHRNTRGNRTAQIIGRILGIFIGLMLVFPALLLAAMIMEKGSLLAAALWIPFILLAYPLFLGLSLFNLVYPASNLLNPAAWIIFGATWGYALFTVVALVVGSYLGEMLGQYVNDALKTFYNSPDNVNDDLFSDQDSASPFDSLEIADPPSNPPPNPHGNNVASTFVASNRDPVPTRGQV